MRQNKGFLLKEINHVSYLLPYGQMIADQKRGLQLNTTGVYLWKLLEQDYTLKELISCSATYYKISPSDMDEFSADITSFVNQLLAYGIIIENDTGHSPSMDTLSLSIGGLGLQLIGDSHAFPAAFHAFVQNDTPQIHQKILFQTGSPSIRENGLVLLRNSELVVLEVAEKYILLFPQSGSIREIHLNKSGDFAVCYCNPPYHEAFHYDIFHALRLVYLYLAQKMGMVALHSASLLYKGKAWLFSGHSGMGKSTHTNLWKELYRITLLNGDLNLLGCDHGQPMVHGIPWCGTSEIYSTQSLPLGGIILLNQASCNRVEELSKDRKQLLISQRLISPAWTISMFEQNMNIVENIEPSILVCKLHCTKEYSAAKTIKSYIDYYLSNSNHE